MSHFLQELYYSSFSFRTYLNTISVDFRTEELYMDVCKILFLLDYPTCIPDESARRSKVGTLT